jgi:hypothetical protein
MITVGYLGANNTQPVQADPTTKVDASSIVLKTAYWPAAIRNVRNTFADGNVPFRCTPGQCLSLPYYEAAALVGAGAATWA